jgi:hypothetical protein
LSEGIFAKLKDFNPLADFIPNMVPKFTMPTPSFAMADGGNNIRNVTFGDLIINAPQGDYNGVSRAGRELLRELARAARNI